MTHTEGHRHGDSPGQSHGRRHDGEQRHDPGEPGDGARSRKQSEARRAERHAGCAEEHGPVRSRAPHPRRRLRREAPSIVAVLAERAHFARMRAYRSFTFDDHGTYLRHTEQLLRSLAAEGVHTRLALFHPAEYARFCRHHHLEPDRADSRARYAAQAAVAGTTLAYDGRPLSRLLPELRAAQAALTARTAAADVLSRAGRCADCGADLARLALDRAAEALAVLLSAAGEGVHHLVCSVGEFGTPLAAALDVRRGPGILAAGSGSAPRLPEPHRSAALTTTLAAGLATRTPGGVVLRSERAGRGGRDVVRGWRLDPGSGWLTPLTTAEVFSAYCTDPDSGDPVPPEQGVDYAPGHPLPTPESRWHC